MNGVEVPRILNISIRLYNVVNFLFLWNMFKGEKRRRRGDSVSSGEVRDMAARERLQYPYSQLNQIVYSQKNTTLSCDLLYDGI
jgi:hypothetical protein